MLGLVWIQIVWHSDGINENNFSKKLILKKISRWWKITQYAKSYPDSLTHLKSISDIILTLIRTHSAYIASNKLNPWKNATARNEKWAKYNTLKWKICTSFIFWYVFCDCNWSTASGSPLHNCIKGQIFPHIEYQQFSNFEHQAILVYQAHSNL